jgi:peptide/nickel transport system substrate-binding protein
MLFAVDEKFEVKPQMVDKWDVSADKLTWTFTLRDGLVWSNGQPVTAEDCIASIKRWGARDSMGQKMMASVAGFEAVDAKDLPDEDEGALRAWCSNRSASRRPMCRS